ncbi:unnamed protein product [Trifolium pratense]|uniref:Uncharacterized protein n=1 Tax=Trifolium pratense TaxID=57577 RepID=A0ACB0IFX3_TRIPR|nr:unnamed protein product [Trifolium pratense]
MSQTLPAKVDFLTMETSPGLNSKACEYEYELQRLSWFWVRQLRLEDPKLDWEKLKRAIFERLFFNTLPNNNSITMETLTLPPPMPPEPPDRVSFRRLHSICFYWLPPQSNFRCYKLHSNCLIICHCAT